MCQFLASIEWLELLQTGAGIFTAYIALCALNTWKHQSKAQKQTHFLDELTDTVHEYIQALSSPTEFLKIIRIRIESHKGLPASACISPHAHVIAYIEAHGMEDSKRLWEYLNSSNYIVAKIYSLVARGQVYGFKNYDCCSGSIKMLLWQHQRLQVVASVIRSTSMNWENSQVKKSLENMLSVDPADIEKHLEEHNLNYINFVNDNYRAIYRGT